MLTKVRDFFVPCTRAQFTSEIQAQLSKLQGLETILLDVLVTEHYLIILRNGNHPLSLVVVNTYFARKPLST